MEQLYDSRNIWTVDDVVASHQVRHLIERPVSENIGCLTSNCRMSHRGDVKYRGSSRGIWRLQGRIRFCAPILNFNENRF